MGGGQKGGLGSFVSKADVIVLGLWGLDVGPGQDCSQCARGLGRGASKVIVCGILSRSL